MGFFLIFFQVFWFLSRVSFQSVIEIFVFWKIFVSYCDTDILRYKKWQSENAEYIKKNLEWELGGIFADEGLSGTDICKRRGVSPYDWGMHGGKNQYDYYQIHQLFCKEHTGLPENHSAVKRPKISLYFLKKRILIPWIPKGKCCWPSLHRWYSRKAGP